jgi:aryl-alcohol dehydrogenase-like predicted oxidoreductase
LGLGLGMTHIDTAKLFVNGKAKELIGPIVEGRIREDIFLTSEVLLQMSLMNIQYGLAREI